MTPFDLQAHRGGAGLWPENTLEAFGRSLALGVSTLELDVHLTAEDDVVVCHDPALADARLIRQLTRADLPPTHAAAAPGRRAARRARAPTPVRINLEIKYDALDAAQLTTREAFVAKVVEALRVDGLVERTSIQCFDWGVLTRVGEAEPALDRNLLVSPKYLKASADAPSPWFDGLAVDADFVRTAAAEGFTAISPIHGSPFLGGVEDPAYMPFASAELVERAHAAGLAVIPYVVDDEATQRHLVRLGVDGLITNRPDRLREVLADEGLAVPAGFSGRLRQPTPAPARLLSMKNLVLAATALAVAVLVPSAPAVSAEAQVESQAPRTVLDVRDLDPGRATGHRVVRATRRQDRRSTGPTGTTTPVANNLVALAPMGSGYVVQTALNRPTTVRWVAADGTPGRREWRTGYGLAVSPQGQVVAFAGRAGKVWTIDQEGDRVLPLQPGPGDRHRASAVTVAGENCKEGEGTPATAARSPSTDRTARSTRPRTASSTPCRT